MAGAAVDLQGAVEPARDLFSMFAVATGSMEVYDAGRVISAPSAVIAGQCPKVTGFCASSTWVQRWCSGFIHEWLRGRSQMLGQPVHDRREMEACHANPIGQRGSVDVDAGPGRDLALAIQMR